MYFVRILIIIVFSFLGHSAFSAKYESSSSTGLGSQTHVSRAGKLPSNLDQELTQSDGKHAPGCNSHKLGNAAGSGEKISLAGGYNDRNQGK